MHNPMNTSTMTRPTVLKHTTIIAVGENTLPIFVLASFSEVWKGGGFKEYFWKLKPGMCKMFWKNIRSKICVSTILSQW